MKKIFFIFAIIFISLGSLGQVFAQTQEEVQENGVNIQVGENTLNLDIFDPTGGWGNVGILALLGLIGQLIFGLLVVVWIFIALLSGLKIVRSQGKAEDIESGTGAIGNMLKGITFGLLFFVAVSVIGMITGAGTVFEWSDNLQECSCEASVEGTPCYTYKFQAEASVEEETVWACERDQHGSKFGKGWFSSLD